MKQLEEGNTVALVSPGFAPKPSVWNECRKQLEQRNLAVKFFGSDDEAEGRFAASDLKRAQHLQSAFEDPDVDAIICTRGGSGCARLLDLLDFERIRANPKLIVGYSDVTVLLIALLSRAGLPALHGPMAVDMVKRSAPQNIDDLHAILTGARTSMAIPADDCRVSKEGFSRGRLFGGNLSVVESLIGTPEFIVPHNAILMLEDVNEFDYRIDRSLVHLRRAGILDRCSALLFGRTALAGDEDPDAFFRIVEPHVADFPGPVVFDLPFGHGDRQMTLPHGTEVELSVSGSGVAIDFSDLWTSVSPSLIAAE